MQVSEPTVEPLQLGDTLGRFEEVATAVAAVNEVLGDEYPLQLRSVDGTTSLLEEVQKPEDAEPATFAGPAAAAIRLSLGIVARENDSPYRLPARKILGAGTGEQPRSKNGLVEDHLRLGTFGHLVAAMKSLESFMGDEEEQAVADKIRGNIKQAPIERAESKPFYYFGSEAEIIHGALIKAALRRESHYDLMAAHILETADRQPMAASAKEMPPLAKAA
jgi:hypothetical protein